MEKPAPSGYEEIGRSIAEAVVLKAMSMTQARGLLPALHYTGRHLKEWIDHYKREQKREIQRQKRKSEANQEKVAMSKEAMEQALEATRQRLRDLRWS